MIKESIAAVIQGRDLTKEEAFSCMQEIMTGLATPSQISGLLVALLLKGETVPEISGFALAMREAALPVNVNSTLVVDSCGTGGDGQGGLNLSTAAAIVAAGTGLKVAKHGNRSISSHCGSADVLEVMGIKVEATAAFVEKEINEVGFGFMFAPAFHPAMKYAMATRKELGVRTVFNILGPLTNPARASVQLIGVYKKELTKKIAEVLAQMGHQAGLVVHTNGWDEITLHAPTQGYEMIEKKVRPFTWTNKNFGLPKLKLADLKGGDANYNAGLIMKILDGALIPARHAVIANAAALIWIAHKSKGKGSISLKDAVHHAREAIESKTALKKLNQLIELSRQAA